MGFVARVIREVGRSLGGWRGCIARGIREVGWGWGVEWGLIAREGQRSERGWGGVRGILATWEVTGLGGERLLVGKGRLWRWEESRCKYFLCMENVNLCFAAANSIMIPKHFVFHLQ